MDDLSFAVRDNYLVITDNSDIPALLQDALRYRNISISRVQGTARAKGQRSCLHRYIFL